MKRRRSMLGLVVCLVALTFASGCAELGEFVGAVLREADNNSNRPDNDASDSGSDDRGGTERERGSRRDGLTESGSAPRITLNKPSVSGMRVQIGGEANVRLREPFTWTWGDGSVTRDDFPAGHVYKRPGTYKIKVTARTTDGRKVAASREVSVGHTSSRSERGRVPERRDETGERERGRVPERRDESGERDRGR